MRYLIALALVVGGLTLPSSAFASPNGPPKILSGGDVNICSHSSSPVCLRDPSDGGTGTAVLASGLSGNNSEIWTTVKDTSRCTGTGKVTVQPTACPFTDARLDSEFVGKTIVVLKQESNPVCVRIQPSTEEGIMGACDTGSELSTAFVFDTLCGGSCNAFIAVDLTNTIGTVEYLENDGVPDNQVFGSNNTSPASDYEWDLTSVP